MAMLQGDHELLHDVREEDLQCERQRLAQVRLALLHGPGTAGLSEYVVWKAGLL